MLSHQPGRAWTHRNRTCLL